tara:strand:+ start:141 stop:1172 length:1032 start_codon:yes stop_codon:yes gene_type:complete
MDQNKTGKYLKYAIGEIVLVVIGILIALSINNWNEKKKSEEKIDKLLVEVLQDLEHNVNLCIEQLKFYHAKDSLLLMATFNNLTREDYTSGKIENINRLTTWHNVDQLEVSAFNDLLEELENVPDRYKLAIKNLKILHKRSKMQYDKYSDIIENLSHHNIQKQADNYEWYSSLDAVNEDKINFMLNDFHYKNEVRHYYTIQRWFQGYIYNYLVLAKKSYKEIAVLINKPINPESFQIDERISNLIEGKWKYASYVQQIGGKNTPIDVANLLDLIYYMEDGSIMYNDVSDKEDSEELIVLSSDLESNPPIVNFRQSLSFFTAKFKGDTMEVYLNNEKVTFYKVK